MRWLVYNVLFTVAWLAALPHFLRRMLRRGGYRKNFLQRVGVFSPATRRSLAARRRIWLHAVSVGEIYVALRFTEEFRRVVPGSSFVVTTTTSTGHRVASAGLSADDVLLYFPVDFPSVVRRVLRVVNPAALILTECELWPNLIRLAAAGGIPVFLINGRISDKSFRGYRALRMFFGPVLRSMDLLLAQSREDQRRLAAIGADPRRIHVLGTAKYDVPGPGPEREREGRAVLRAAGIDPQDAVLVGGSTWPGEEEILLRLLRRLAPVLPGLRLVLVPRHAERRREVESVITAHGCACVRRSELRGGAPRAGDPSDVLLVDTTGELVNFYACATAIFVGKSLTSRGGQNIIEPALFGKPIVVGPHTGNFAAVVADFLAADAIVQVRDAVELEQRLRSLLTDPASAAALGARARALVEARRGVVAESVRRIGAVIRGPSGVGSEESPPAGRCTGPRSTG